MTTVKIVGLYVFCIFFGLLVASLPVLAKEKCPAGYDRVEKQINDQVKVVVCQPAEKRMVCETKKRGNVTEKRCYRVRAKNWHRTSEPPKKHERGKKMTYEELLNSLQAKKAQKEELSPAESLLLAYEKGEKQRKSGEK